MTAMFCRAASRARSIVAVLAGLFVAVTAAHIVSGASRNELPVYHFTVAIEGLETGQFREVQGLSIETEIVEFREGGSNDAVRKLPGRTKWPNIVLKQGFTGSTLLADWAFTQHRTGIVIRRSGTITMFDQTGRTVAAWTFHNAWPVKWEGPTLKSSGNEVAIESIELAHEGLSLLDDNR